MNYKTDSGYEVLYPQTTTSNIILSPEDQEKYGENNLTELLNKGIVNVGDIVTWNFSQGFQEDVEQGKYLSCDGQILSSSEYSDYYNIQGALPIIETNLSDQGESITLAKPPEMKEVANGRIIIIQPESTSQASIYRSDDSGNSYTLITSTTTTGAASVKIFFNEATGEIVCMIYGGGVFYSNDNGDSFSKISDSSSWNLSYDPENGSIYSSNGILMSAYGNNVKYSRDRGVNWQQWISIGFTGSYITEYNNYIYLILFSMSTSSVSIYMYRTVDLQSFENYAYSIETDSQLPQTKISFFDDKDGIVRGRIGDKYIVLDLNSLLMNVQEVVQLNSSNAVNNPTFFIYSPMTCVQNIISNGINLSIDYGKNWYTFLQSTSFNDRFLVLKNKKILAYKTIPGGSYKKVVCDPITDKILIPNIPDHFIKVK